MGLFEPAHGANAKVITGKQCTVPCVHSAGFLTTKVFEKIFRRDSRKDAVLAAHMTQQSVHRLKTRTMVTEHIDTCEFLVVQAGH